MVNSSLQETLHSTSYKLYPKVINSKNMSLKYLQGG
jgi:hypothetical protein